MQGREEQFDTMYLFCPCGPYSSRVSFIGEEEGEEEEEEKKKKEEKERKKENDDFDFFKIRFLGFYKAELKSEDIFVLRSIRAFRGYPFCWLLLCLDILSTGPIVQSKHFNHPHPYIEIAVAISDLCSMKLCITCHQNLITPN